jgi:hypothetical protein
MKATTTKTVACYVRISTVGQNKVGQRAEIERWLAGNGIGPEAVRWYMDKGRSGDSLMRPAFDQLQAAVFAGDVGTVVVYRLDRLSHSLWPFRSTDAIRRRLHARTGRRGDRTASRARRRRRGRARLGRRGLELLQHVTSRPPGCGRGSAGVRGRL